LWGSSVRWNLVLSARVPLRQTYKHNSYLVFSARTRQPRAFRFYQTAF
jgi:hypothetical protein